jgi:hypothetical protein
MLSVRALANSKILVFNNIATRSSKRPFSIDAKPSILRDSLASIFPEALVKNAGMVVFLSGIGGIVGMIYRSSAVRSFFLMSL